MQAFEAHGHAKSLGNPKSADSPEKSLNRRSSSPDYAYRDFECELVRKAGQRAVVRGLSTAFGTAPRGSELDELGRLRAISNPKFRFLTHLLTSHLAGRSVGIALHPSIYLASLSSFSG